MSQKSSFVTNSLKYKNYSQIQFMDKHQQHSEKKQQEINFQKKRPKSYRNISRLAEFMKDIVLPTKSTEKVQYINIIQNTNKTFQIPQPVTKLNQNQQHRYQQFLQKNANRMYKPVDQFCQYSDLITRNSSLIRKDQFKQQQTRSRFLNSQNSPTMSMIHSRYYNNLKAKKYSKMKLTNSIRNTYQCLINQKKSINQQKVQFLHSKKKQVKAFNKTFMGSVSQYDQLLKKQRSEKDLIPFKNSMNRVLQMELMGKKMQNLTQTFT